MVTSREFIDWGARSPSDRRAAADELENSFEHAAGPIDLRAYVGTRPEERFSALTERPCVRPSVRPSVWRLVCLPPVFFCASVPGPAPSIPACLSAAVRRIRLTATSPPFCS